jgi:hypothetical protein
MRCTENACGNIVGTELVILPLALLRVVADKRDRHIVLVEDRNPTVQFRDDGVVPMKTNLARTWSIVMLTPFPYLLYPNSLS